MDTRRPLGGRAIDAAATSQDVGGHRPQAAISTTTKRDQELSARSGLVSLQRLPIPAEAQHAAQVTVGGRLVDDFVLARGAAEELEGIANRPGGRKPQLGLGAWICFPRTEAAGGCPARAA